MTDPEFRVEDVTEICRILRSTLGPFGTNKLLVGEDGTVRTTTSAAALLERIDVSDPGLTLLRTAASEFRTHAGDGTGSVVALAGALLEEAERLHEMGIHPTVVDRGFRTGLDVAATTVDDVAEDAESVEPVVETALTATRDPGVRRQVGSFVAESVRRIRNRDGDAVDLASDVGVLARLGGSHSETELVPGVVLDAEPAAKGMPRRLADAGIAVLSSSVDVDGLGTVTSRRDDATVEIRADSFEERAAIGDHERESFRETVREALDAGCRCLVTSGSVTERVQTVLGAEGVLALHQIDDAAAARIARATGARTVPDLSHVTGDTLGRADVTVTRRAGRDVTVVRGDPESGIYTVFCRAPDPRSTDAFERSVESAIAAVAMAEESGVVPAGGAIEMAAARRVKAEARSLSGREQLATEAFAHALESIPRALAENAGLDAAAAMTRLRARHGEGDASEGVEASVGEVTDVLAEGPLVEPAVLKQRVFEAATDLAVQLVRVDDTVSATDLSDDDRREQRERRMDPE